MINLKKLFWKIKITYKLVKNMFKYGDPLIFRHYKHVKLWLWLYDNPDKDKRDWPGWDNCGHVQGLCFACEYAYIKRMGDNYKHNSCYYCPFKIMDEKFTNSISSSDSRNCLKSKFIAWEVSEGNNKLRRKLAMDIAMLELKDDILTDFMVYGEEKCDN